MHLLKCVPIGAGLGGGSADGAFAIKALNDFFSVGIPEEKQLAYARRLGSDCAFFIQNQAAYCFGKGDEFENIAVNLKGKWLVLVNPGIHISTVEAYSGIIPKKSHIDLRKVLQEPIASWEGVVKNDFEATLFLKYPLLSEIKKQLYETGAEYAAMSGSGSTLYGIFPEEQDLRRFFPDYTVWQGYL
jgi:4-diphosphocytidyl-2-C-methyl-D-erythritol kinase